MNAPRIITLFRCTPLRNAELTRSSCAARWESLNHGKGAKRSASGGPALVGRECVGCVIGKAHADGDRPDTWPDGSRIELIDKSAPAVVLQSPPRMPKPARALPVLEPAGARRTSEPIVAPVEPEHRREEPVVARSDRHDYVGSWNPETGVTSPIRGRTVDVLVVDDPAPIPTGGNPAEAGEEIPLRARVVTAHGITRTVEEWAKHHGMTTSAIQERVRRNWPLELAVFAPKGSSYENSRVPPPKSRRKKSLEGTMVTHDGKTQDVLAWAHEVGITMSAIRLRLRSGRTIEEACTTPNLNVASTARVAARVALREREAAKLVDANTRSVPDPLPILDALASAAASLPSSSPAVELLRAAGYVVVSSSRAPAGLVIVVRE